jgi:hypothetical protein
MVRKIVLEDDSFMEEEIVDDYEVLREIRNASWPRDREFHAREPDAPNDLLFTAYGVTGMETFDEDQTWRNRIRSRKPPRN